MRSKNSRRIDATEAAHLEAVKSQPCSVCDAPPPSDAHHINQGDHFTTVALCKDCHQGSENGIHGRRVMWRVMKLDELSALNITLRRIISEVK